MDRNYLIDALTSSKFTLVHMRNIILSFSWLCVKCELCWAVFNFSGQLS